MMISPEAEFGFFGGGGGIESQEENGCNKKVTQQHRIHKNENNEPKKGTRMNNNELEKG